MMFNFHDDDLILSSCDDMNIIFIIYIYMFYFHTLKVYNKIKVS